MGLRLGGGAGLSYGGWRASGNAAFDGMASRELPVDMSESTANGILNSMGRSTGNGDWGGAEPMVLAAGADFTPGRRAGPQPFTPPTVGDALSQGWKRQGWSVLQGERPVAYDLASTTRTFLGGITGYDSTNAARSSFAQGDYVKGTLQALQAFGEAGSTAFGFGAGSATTGLRVGGMTASEMAAVRATYVETRIGNSSLATPGVEYATVNGQKVFPQNYSQLYHGTDNATLGLSSSMSADDVAQHLYANGLPARGSNIDLIDHTINNASDRAFRGTTVVPITQERNAGAAFWAGDRGLVIEMKGVSGYDVNAALEGRVLQNGRYGGNPKFGELEVAVPGAISPGSISRVGVPTVNRNGVPEVQWIVRKQ